MTAALAELCKMGLQLLGALLVARLAVSWALGRYKSEKMWERETTAVLDLLATLSELEELIAVWLEEHYSDSTPPKDVQDERVRRFRAARVKVGAIASAASVILPPALAKQIDQLIAVIDHVPEDDYADAYERELEAIRGIREILVSFGRSRSRLH